MKAYDELKARRKHSAKKSKAQFQKLQKSWDIVENNYGELIFDEVERNLLPAGSLSNRFLRLLLGKSQDIGQKPALLAKNDQTKPAVAVQTPLIKQAISFAKPLLLTMALGLIKRKVRRGFHRKAR